MRRKILLAGLAVSVAPVLVRVALLGIWPIPQPRIHDEFSHLLTADLVAHGRLAAPVHPMWKHFESMHILVRPAYASAFPLAQGMVLGVAQAAAGRPWIGVALSCGLMAGALYWMLLGWVSWRWALAGAAIAAARWGVSSYWMNSYYGGAVAAAAGALVLGALPRLWRRPDWRLGVVFGIGLAVLANSRPYEGLLLALPCTAALAWRCRQQRVWAAVGSVLLLAGAAMAWHFQRVSGVPWRLPYTVYRTSMTRAPHFLWQEARAERWWNHRVLRNFHDHREMVVYQAARSNQAPYGLVDKVKDYGRFYFGPVLLAPLLVLPGLWRNHRSRWLMLLGGWFAAGLAVEVWHSPHYAAPAAGVALLLAVQGLRWIRVQRHGRFAAGVVVAAAMATPVITEAPSGEPRAAVLRQLEAAPGRHLVLVRYQRFHEAGDEWVYNNGLIDDARVVWAREMDPQSNRELQHYFAGRRVWLVEPDERPVRVRPYAESPLPDPPFAFVPLGAESVTVLRWPEQVARRTRSLAGKEELACDQWNYFFTQATQVEAPQGQGCWTRGRGERVSFEDWWTWLLRQK